MARMTTNPTTKAKAPTLSPLKALRLSCQPPVVRSDMLLPEI
jgi:hypothetical protein